MRNALRRGALAAIALAAAVGALGAAFPAPQGAVNDFAHVLDAASSAELARLAAGVRERTTAEIAIVTVPSLDGLTVEDYANKLFAAWGIGKKGKDNGVLILVAPAEHKVRIEVGYGLEPVLPDGLAGEIIRTELLPAFKAGDYKGGLLRGTRHVADIVAVNHALSPAEREAMAGAKGLPGWVVVPLMTAVAGGGAFLFALGLRAKAVIPTVLGALLSGVPMLVSLVLETRWTPYAVWPAGLLAFAVGCHLGAGPDWIRAMRGKRRRAGNHWVAGFDNPGRGSGDSFWSSGKSDSSGGSSGGGFGGGSSGGGGASGSW